jgi:hypothetical protein
MIIVVKVINALLSHDTELFSNMVEINRYRIHTSSSRWALSAIVQGPARMAARGQSGMKDSSSPPLTIPSKSLSWTKIPSRMTSLEKAPSI